MLSIEALNSTKSLSGLKLIWSLSDGEPEAGVAFATRSPPPDVGTVEILSPPPTPKVSLELTLPLLDVLDGIFVSLTNFLICELMMKTMMMNH